ncbi:MAG: TonB-dependent receptor [Burkholderiales bacterium]|nr:TonB-dependent receptor [Burkholderiales bacterium]
MYEHNSVRARLFRRSLLAAACIAAAAPVLAQSAADAGTPETLQRVEVTGSRIKQIDAEGVSPVQTLRREDITRTGATNVRELLDSLSATSTSGTLSDIGGSNSFASGASGASLRNLGKQSTLVLLNGRRISAFPLADYNEVFSNVDSLPLEAIDRIEILKSGGSAVYGSDAVAGVINIITRPGFKGVQLNYSGEKSLRNGRFGERSGSITGGMGDYEKDGYNILGNVEVFHRDNVMWSDVLKDVNPQYASHSPGIFGAKSTYAYPGNIVGQGPVLGCEPVVSHLCRYDKYQRFQAVPGAKRMNTLVSSRVRLDADTEWFSELTTSDINVNYQSPYQAYGPQLGSTVWGDPSTGAGKTFYYRGLPAENPLNQTGEEADFRYRFVDGPSYNQTNTTQYRLLTGVKGVYKAFDWESAVGVMGGHTSSLGRGAFSDSGFIKEIGDYNADTLAPDFFNKAGGYQIGQVNSAEVLNTLFPVYGYSATNHQDFWDAKINGDLTQLPAGPLQLATGFELRHETLKINPTSNLANGDIVGYGTSAAEGTRNFGAVFAELGIPIAKHLDGDLAGRLDKFPGFGAHFSPKVGLKFKPVDQALFRGTYETGFRAPNLTESARSTKFAFDPNISDPKRCDAASALHDALIAKAAQLGPSDPQSAILEARALQVSDNECGASIPIVTANNPSLKPETSKSLSLGTVLQPFQHWSMSLDYWAIHRRDEIGTRDLQDLLVNEDSLAPGVINRGSVASDPTFLPSDAANYGITLPTVGRIQQVTVPFQNLFQTKTSGIDFGLKGSVPTAIGEFGLEIDATVTLSYKQYSNTLGRFGDNLAGRYSYPKFVSNTTLSYKAGNFDQSLRYAFRSRTALQEDYNDTVWSTQGCADNAGLTADECHVKTYHRVDYSISYGGFKNMTLGLFIGNLFQKRPPADYRAANAPSTVIPFDTEDAAGRTGKVIFQYKWQ